MMKNNLIKKIIIVSSLTAMFCTACGNKDFIDMTYTYDTAIIYLPNGEIVEGKVQSWTDYSDGDQIQVKINDNTYLVHSSNIVLIKSK